MNITSLVNTQGPLSPITDGLILYWSFNENTGDRVYDLSGYNNHGTLNGSPPPTWAFTGSKPQEIGSSIAINDVASYVVSDRILDMPVSSSGTLSIWAMCSTATSNKVWISCANWSTDRNGFTLVNSNTATRFAFEVCGPSSATTWNPIGTIVNTGNIWRMITITWDTSGYNAYLNGVFNSLYTGAPPYITPNIYKFHVGRGGDNGSYNINNAYIDDVRVYTRALSDSEVYILYKNTGG